MHRNLCILHRHKDLVEKMHNPSSRNADLTRREEGVEDRVGTLATPGIRDRGFALIVGVPLLLNSNRFQNCVDSNVNVINPMNVEMEQLALTKTSCVTAASCRRSQRSQEETRNPGARERS